MVLLGLHFLFWQLQVIAIQESVVTSNITGMSEPGCRLVEGLGPCLLLEVDNSCTECDVEPFIQPIMVLKGEVGVL